jgi:transposase InsO family protein
MFRRELSPREQEIMLFRYGLISDLIHVPQGRGSGVYALIQAKSREKYQIPYSERTTITEETIKQWLKRYRQEGVDGLCPKKRKDKGSVRHLPQEVIDLILVIKEAHYSLTVSQVIAKARKHKEIVPEGMVIPRSTVHRHLKAAGLMKKRPKDGSPKDLRRFGYEKAGELCMSDVMHGPRVFVEGNRKHKTYLVGFIDDATRMVPYAEFRLSESVQDYLPVLREALQRRGKFKRLYVDNGAAFKSQHLRMVCARLDIELINATPYHAAGKGKQERWFRTVRTSFLPTLKDADLSSLEALNRRLWTWVETEYHQRPHRGLDGMTPFDAWCLKSSDVQPIDPNIDFRELFLFEEQRRVQKDRTVSLDGAVYEVDAVLVGEKVTLRFDPSKPGSDIDVWHEGNRIQTARLVDAYANCYVKRDRAHRIKVTKVKTDKIEKPPVRGFSLADLEMF